MRLVGALMLLSVTVLVGCTQSTEPTPDLESTVAVMVATQIAGQPTATPINLPSPTPTAVTTALAAQGGWRSLIYDYY